MDAGAQLGPVGPVQVCGEVGRDKEDGSADGWAACGVSSTCRAQAG